MQGCPNCFAKPEKSGCLKRGCEYYDSCRYCAENDGKRAHGRLGHVSYDRYSYSREVSVSPDLPKDSSEEMPELRIMEFLLDIDNYSAELLSAVIHNNANTTSDLARQFGVSRQAIHRKIVDCCTLHPELRKLFAARLYRCRRVNRNSERIEAIRNRRYNKNQMEFNF